MNPRLSAFLSRRLLDRAGGHRGRVLAAFEAARDLALRDRAAIEAHQRALLAELLRHASASVPRFGPLLPPPGEIREENAHALWQALPVMRRADLQADPVGFTAPGVEAVEDATGGSSGTPMTFRVDSGAQVAREASLLWADSLTGWRVGERIAMLWGADRDVRDALRNSRLALRWRIENRRWYNAFDMGPERLEAYHRALERFRPHLLTAYAGSAFALARALRYSGRRAGYPLRAVVTSAEVLTPTMRAAIEEVMAAPVFDRYGNREVGAIAAECDRHQGLHVNEADVLVEIDSPDPARVPGPILVTALRNRAMPFLRYDTGDLGTLQGLERCACGRSNVRMGPIVGRRSDTIRTADGRWIHGEFFSHLLYGVDGVRRFRFVQESPDAYRLLVEADPALVARHAEAWRARILEAVGPAAAVRVEAVDRLEPLPSGKHRFTVAWTTDA